MYLSLVYVGGKVGLVGIAQILDDLLESTNLIVGNKTIRK